MPPLTEGVWLEDVQLLLPWNSDISTLARIGSPRVAEAATRSPLGRVLGGTTHLAWDNHSILGGLASGVRYGSAQPNVFHLEIDESHRRASPRETFDHLRAQLELRFGADHSFGTDEWGLPHVVWMSSDSVVVALAVADRFTECVSFSISNEDPACAHLREPQAFPSSMQLERGLAVVRANVADGTIVEVAYLPAGKPVTGQPPFAELSAGSWPEVFQYYFACTTCGALYRFSAETAHGSGGTWQPVTSES